MRHVNLDAIPDSTGRRVFKVLGDEDDFANPFAGKIGDLGTDVHRRP